MDDGLKFGLAELGRSVPGGSSEEAILPVAPSPGFDLENYISNYTGRTRAYRLKHIAQRCPSLQQDALRYFTHGCKQHMYNRLYQRNMCACSQTFRFPQPSWLFPTAKLADDILLA